MSYKGLLFVFLPIISTPLKLFDRLWMLLSWEVIMKHLDNKLISSSYILIVIVPMLVKVLSKVPDTIVIFNIDFVVKLPFSWYYIYFAAISFFIAKIFYLFIAPNIYKSNFSFDDFEKKGKTKEHLKYYIRDGYFVNSKFHLKYENKLEKKDVETKTLFWDLWNDLNYELKTRRFVISMFLFLGYFFIGLIMIENFIYVISLFENDFSKSSLKMILETIWNFLK